MTRMIARLLSVLLWLAAALVSLSVTIGNVQLVKISESAEYAGPDLRLTRDISVPDIPVFYPAKLISNCITTWLRTEKDLRLKQLDLLYGHESLAQSQARLQETHDFLLRYLRCNPGDGYAWLSAALIVKTMNNDDEAIMKYLSLSRFYAPDDPTALRARQDILTGTSARLRKEYKDLWLNAAPIFDDTLSQFHQSL